MMKITCIMWNSYARLLRKAAAESGHELRIFTNSVFEQNPERIDDFLFSCMDADVILMYRTTHSFWDDLEPEIKKMRGNKPVICVGHDTTLWGLTSVPGIVAATTYAYLTNNGEANMLNLLRYLEREVLGHDIAVDPPQEVPWQGLWHPDAPRYFLEIREYLNWHSSRIKSGAPWVGILFPRMAWASGAVEIETALIRELESEGLNVIPVFTYSVRDDALGARGMADIIMEYLVDNSRPRVGAIIKLTPFLLGAARGDFYGGGPAQAGIGILSKLNIPVFQPVISHRMTVDQWRESIGLGDDIGWAVALPEFEGVIEPIFIGSSAVGDRDDREREVVPDRCSRIARRVKSWLTLAAKPIWDRKVAFILNNNPCSSVEGNVGGAAQLDSLESVSCILRRMEAAGYSVTPPADGKELIRTILDRKAISEFRWTTVADIVAKGGTLALLDAARYEPFFNDLSPKVMERIRTTWGDPPGSGMVHEGKIVITGVTWGNAVVCVQPKRGCYGARCDGEVCKILHDPECPPPYQYIATYRYLTDVFGADVIVHVGTHGNLEFLPGKGAGLSRDCFPDIGIKDIPHLYIYNADNPAEGTIAKRRSYAVLVDHMQTVMTQSGLYDELIELDRLLGEYETARTDPSRAHALQHLIRDAVASAKLDKDMHVTHETPLGELVTKAHEALSRIRNTQIQRGQHIFGRRPTGDKRADMIRSIIRFDSGEGSARHLVAGMLGLTLSDLLSRPEQVSEKTGIPNGVLLERINGIIKRYVAAVLDGGEIPYSDIFGREPDDSEHSALAVIAGRIRDIDRRIEASDEIGSLLNGFSGGYVPAGPSGIITRGQEDILPTGRNFYSLDPNRVPTRSAWRVGQRLADAMVAKYVKEHGSVPESVAFYWMAGDLMYADGEMMAEMFALLGVEPFWGRNGRVESFTITPLEKLGRPRIDLTVRSSGILRDNFSTRIDLLDDAVCAVAALDEPPEKNFVRKHSIKSRDENASSWRDATIRVFASPPGTYSSGVNLAVLASAWKDEKDLADIFVAFNGYGYGRGIPGRKAHPQLASSLASVSVTFNKVVTDEKDLLGCCCYFGNHGGLTVAARQYSGRDVKAYYGDTREPEHVEVRGLADELRRVVRTKLLNPKWIEGMKEHGYKGAADIMKRISRVYGWEASTQEVDDWIFDDIARTFVNDDEMREFFERNNPYALEEIARRLLEAEQRGLWNADEKVLEDLRNNYLEVESWMEDQVTEGDFQGGGVDIFTSEDVAAWGGSVDDLLAKVHNRPKRE
ncbi:MAG: cobaltochelatase subunit CobN [Methanoregula sp. PtaU1.Bin051]|nr:MAG: cobaltochelatase subunit CobN [Methanoregula sp. PtaU1.Bin051]